jgi:hypothetical protein
MKQVLFILLAIIFISCTNQQKSNDSTIKLNRIGLEIMKTDLGKLTWEEANKACKKLGGDWRLPTKEEIYLIYNYKDRIGGFVKLKHAFYWSRTENNFGWTFYFFDGVSEIHLGNSGKGYVRAVRTLE